MTSCKKKSNASAKSTEKYCSSCPSRPKFVEEKKTCHPLTSHVTPSFSHAKESRTPFDLYWNNYYKKHAEEMDYDVVPVKEDLIIEYNCQPPNSGPITHKPAGTIHWVNNCTQCGETNYCEEADEDENVFLASSIDYYTKGDNLGTTNFTCSDVTSSTPAIRFGSDSENVYILQNNQQGMLYLNGPNGQYSIPTWDKTDEYYMINMGNDKFNNSVFLVYGSPSIAVCVCFNEYFTDTSTPDSIYNPYLVLEQFVYADCGTWYLISNTNQHNGFAVVYGTYNSQNQQFSQDGNWETNNTLKVGGSEANPIQVAINMTNTGSSDACANAVKIYLEYYTVIDSETQEGKCYIRPIGGNNQWKPDPAGPFYYLCFG
jgi:hypothetical protein